MPKKAGKPAGKSASKKKSLSTSEVRSGEVRAGVPPQNDKLESLNEQEAQPDARAARNGFPVVAIGASAGGLEAFSQLLAHLPPTTGMAYVLIQHLDPTHISQLPGILSKRSKMPVLEVHADTLVEPDHIYVIAANENLRIEKGVLLTVPRPVSGVAGNKAIDAFMESLAHDLGSRSFGVVLSGTASDGTLGLRAIKAEGGITFAQEPSSAKFDGMPSSAIAAGAVDFVMPPEAIAKQLVSLSYHPYVARSAPALPAEAATVVDADLSPIFSAVRAATGVDFTYYKHNTLRRRIERRMAMHDIADIREYTRRLRHDPAEAKTLAQEFLINVTSFFREPGISESLRETVLPALIEGRAPDDQIRVWIPGCSTGEEAYTLAINLMEFFEARGVAFGVQIFATDLSDSVIERARAGFYPENAVAGLSEERLKRFFIKRDRVYQVNQSLRNLCVFAKQDVTKDPPFSKIDLISCCNLLIYLGPVLQKRVISVFHYALKPGGFLMLGSSESANSYAEAFQIIDRKRKIYSKKKGATHLTADLAGESHSVGMIAPQSATAESVAPLKEIQKQVDRMLLSEYAPAGVIVDDSMQVLHVRGDTGAYLQFPPGEPTTDLTRLVRPGLLAALKSAVRKARHQGAPVTESGLRLEGNGRLPNVDLRVSPIRDPHGTEQYFLIVFDDKRGAAEPPHRSKAKSSKTSGRIANSDEILRLEQELRATRDYLQSIIESQEAATEELRSANEEAQATNEELDTAKEELQATNEELNTVNDELRARNTEQSTLNSELRKLLESINIPLVMVGRNLQIRWFTPAMEPLLNLLPSDQGRPITDLHSAVIPNFKDLLVAALAGEQNTSLEMESPAGRWLSLRILPYRGVGNAIEGAIATLIDIDDLKRARDFAEAIVAVAREPLLVLDGTLRVRTANHAFLEIFQLEKQDVEGRLIYEVGSGQWNIPSLKDLLEDILPKHGFLRDFEVRQTHGLGARTMLLHAREIRQGEERMILLAIDDITQLRQSSEELRKINADLKQFIYAASHDLQEPIRTIGIYTDKLIRKYASPLGEEGTLFVKYVVDGAHRLENLVTGLRDFWQLSESVEEQRAFVDCNQILKTVLRDLENLIAESGATVTSDPLPSVMASEAPLIQLFQNLIGNAIKYRSPDAPRVHISAVKGPSEWTFSIEDNGIGIDPKYFNEVFGVFKRLHTHSKYPGTGIGLAICQKIVERYGGRIWVEANPGSGSTFKFTIAS